MRDTPETVQCRESEPLFPKKRCRGAFSRRLPLPARSHPTANTGIMNQAKGAQRYIINGLKHFLSYFELVAVILSYFELV
jgi:hypothetical protein